MLRRSILSGLTIYILYAERRTFCFGEGILSGRRAGTMPASIYSEHGMVRVLTLTIVAFLVQLVMGYPYSAFLTCGKCTKESYNHTCNPISG